MAHAACGASAVGAAHHLSAAHTLKAATLGQHEVVRGMVHLPISPHISPYLACISPYLPISPCISLYLPRCYYPQLTRDEAVLIKCWDSYGRDFAPHHATPGLATVPATFALHSGFEDPATPLTLNRIEILTP